MIRTDIYKILIIVGFFGFKRYRIRADIYKIWFGFYSNFSWFGSSVPRPKYGLKLLMFKLLSCVLGEEESCASVAKAQEVRSP